MANQQYDVPKKLRRLFEEKQKIREAIRQAVLKRQTSPYPTPRQIDPAIIRYHAMLTYKVEHAYLNQRNVAGFVGFIVVPFLLILGSLLHHTNEKEKLYRSGKLSYKERYRKVVL